MEFFEKAHTVKKSSKDTIKEQFMKKQLKEMLHGYKHNNTEVIKQSSERKPELDDILSMSSITEYEALSVVRESEDTSKEDDNNISKDSTDTQDTSDLSLNESTENLQNDTKTTLFKNDDIKSIKMSSGISSSCSSCSSDEFDADGQLASKILKRLDAVDVHSASSDSEVTTNSIISNNSNDSIGLSHLTLENNTIPNVSIKEIFHQYKHSTVRNVPDGYVTGILQEDALKHFSVPLDQDRLSDDVLTDTAITDKEDVDVTDHAMLYDACNGTLDAAEANIEDSSQQLQTLDDTADEDVSTQLTNQVDIYYCRNLCIFVLRHPAEIYLHGKVTITPMAGCVKLFGSVLNGPCDVYAPNNSFAQRIETLPFHGTNYGLFGKLTALGLSVPETEDIVTTLGENDAVIMLQPLSSRKIDFVEESFLTLDLFSKQNKHVCNYFKKASDLLGISLYLTRPWKYLDENPSWDNIIKFGMNGQSRGVLCGGKGAGKSTFLRYYVNSLLANGPVLVIDLDPGQAEFTVAGCLSAVVVKTPLLGPNYTHLTQADRTLNIGMINVMDNMKRYTNAVSNLLAFCRSRPQYSAMPWIVNTMGMSNSVGLKLMALIILQLKPTFLVQFDSSSTKKRFEYNLTADRIEQLYHKSHGNYMFRNVTCPQQLHYEFFVSRQDRDVPVNTKSGLAPRDERYLNFLGYFGELMEIHRHSEFLGIVPYEIPLRNFYIGANVNIKEDDVNKVINGKIIALCQLTADKATKMFRLDDKPLLCLGYGLVRGVDAARGMLYVATPTPRELLQQVDSLVYCDWVPELLGQARRLPQGAHLPYRTDTLPDHRQLMFTPKRRFNPIQLLKMARAN